MDPLAASALALLDKHSSLRLVTDAVHEDDALCLALTCRALRDALWARFPRRPAGDAHVGMRVRTRDAAVVGTVGRLAWARGLDRPWAYSNRSIGWCYPSHKPIVPMGKPAHRHHLRDSRAARRAGLAAVGAGQRLRLE
jgi:hypothetical protein